ncbi:MAG: hypothetical protein KF740_20415, partial [Ramlibacter sp.]|nr:hypothetical protein [Ramlibacter sp.]
MAVTRRALFERVLQGIGAGVVAGAVDRALADSRVETTGQASGPLTVRVSRPFDAETPVREFTSWLTANERFFVR